MQSNAVKAFRQRLIRAGFKNIHISCYRDTVYLSCLTRDNNIIQREYTCEQINYLPVIKYLL